MDRRDYLRALGVGGAASLSGCVADGDGGASAPSLAAGRLTLATATTAHDSGLLGRLNPGFREAFGAEVRTLVEGTGAALRTAQDGDCDVVLVHARPLEDRFLREGHGVNRRTLMRNDFLLVGPRGDPAAAAGRPVTDAFRAVARAGTPFLSRGDDSGTHVRERRIWDAASVDPTGAWYRETGQGMGDTLTTADEVGAYTLTDRGTFLTLRPDVDLVAHVDHGIADPPPLLRNEYGLIPVNPARHDVAYPLAMAYVGYLTGPAQAAIRRFRRDGERAFHPTARSPEPRFEQYVPTDWSGD
ncbi:substrate-binding domain-containing protein [Haloglomus halophilum]|uniref:substrate-binding domain-containing protein n=1 Tax=Haloglomus halophilum TaxID=2962672 RepID=UPI0020C9474E|nr:substrate-binding domain-containing protein [Haloglomus halophilum]